MRDHARPTMLQAYADRFCPYLEQFAAVIYKGYKIESIELGPGSYGFAITLDGKTVFSKRTAAATSESNAVQEAKREIDRSPSVYGPGGSIMRRLKHYERTTR